MNTAAACRYNLSKIHEIDALQALGWLPGFPNKPATESFAVAVADFQQAQNLTADGACGPSTWAALRRLHAPASWLRAIPKGLPAIEATYGKRGKVAPVTTKIFAGSGRAVLFHPILGTELATLLDLASRLSGYTPKDIQTFNVRKKRGGDNPGKQWSTHSWPIAFDADPSDNPWGNKPTSPLIAHPQFLAVFRAAGWRCGADWKTPDTMHVQACWGY